MNTKFDDLKERKVYVSQHKTGILPTYYFVIDKTDESVELIQFTKYKKPGNGFVCLPAISKNMWDSVNYPYNEAVLVDLKTATGILIITIFETKHPIKRYKL